MSADVSRDTLSVKVAMQVMMKRLGRRHRVMHGGTLCGHCYERPPAKGQRHCRECHNEFAKISARRKREKNLNAATE